MLDASDNNNDLVAADSDNLEDFETETYVEDTSPDEMDTYNDNDSSDDVGQQNGGQQCLL